MTEKDVMAALNKFREECEARDKATNETIAKLQEQVTFLSRDVDTLSKELAWHKLAQDHSTGIHMPMAG
jgi:hypothetical protein